MSGARARNRTTQTVAYQLDAILCAMARNFHQSLAGTGFRPRDVRALAVVKEHPGCDQTTLGRALVGNRSLGMKVASRLEEKGLLVRQGGRDGRSKGLFLTSEGERVLGELPKPDTGLTTRMISSLEPAEWEVLRDLLSKIQCTVNADEETLCLSSAMRVTRGSKRGQLN